MPCTQRARERAEMRWQMHSLEMSMDHLKELAAGPRGESAWNAVRAFR